MAKVPSTLDPENIPEPDRQLRKGHGTAALGPSDTSDTGSDVQGGPGLLNEAGIGLDRGTNEDSEGGRRDRTAGPDIGDADLNSDTDAVGTGERATAGRDSDMEMGRDIDIDRIEQVYPEEGPDSGETAMPAPRERHPKRPQQQRR